MHHYSGTDRQKALAVHVRVREDLEAGRKPRPADAEGRTVADVVTAFLSEKKNREDAGELSAPTRRTRRTTGSSS
jgi:hypothetical protein